jgi:hypothetical protein
MFSAAAPRILRTCLAAAAVCASVMTAQAVTTPSDAAPIASAPVRSHVALRLGTTPAGHLTVLDANVEEYLSAPDNRDHHDLNNFVKRVARVLGAERAKGAAVHTPDLVFLQEVDMATARAVRVRLSRALHRKYVIAGLRGLGPAHGRGSIVRGRTRHHALLTRATAVLYNSHTLRRPSSAHVTTFAYPHRQVWSSAACRRARVECQAGMWESRQAIMFRFVAKRSGQAYAVASVHFVPYPFLRPRLGRHQRAGFREGLWFSQLARRLHHFYPHAKAILAGDFNEHVCVHAAHRLGSRACNSTHEYTPLYRAARAAGFHDTVGVGIDHIFTRGRTVTRGRDVTYKRFGRDVTSAGRMVSHYLNARDFRLRFGSSSGFNRCESLYNYGAGLSRRARAIPGCTNRFYSDHPFDWAVIR